MGHDVPIFSNLFQVSAEDVPFASLVAESSDPVQLDPVDLEAQEIWRDVETC